MSDDNDYGTCAGCDDTREEVGRMFGTLLLLFVVVPTVIGLVVMIVGGVVHAIRNGIKH